MAMGLLRTSKKCRLGGQNCSGSSGPEKLLKIVNVEINKETNETDWRSRWNRWVATNIHLDHNLISCGLFHAVWV
jgi:hypothetical protein